MRIQTWIVCNNTILAAKISMPHKSNGKVVVLFSGLNKPMCDQDFFMSKLARRLNNRGFIVMQVDPRGHGDSSGDFSEVTLEHYVEDIKLAVEYAKKEFPSETHFCVGRGISGTLLFLHYKELNIKGAVGINPFLFSLKEVSSVLSDIYNGKIPLGEVIDKLKLDDCSHFSDEQLTILRQMLDYGVLESKNTSTDLIYQVNKLNEQLFSIYPFNGNVLWLLDDIEGGIKSRKPQINDQYIQVHKDHTSLKMDALWQHYAIEETVEWLIMQ